ncbi:MAG: hypothetical protein WD534_12970 [Phycisphaeraceae bacterium]
MSEHTDNAANRSSASLVDWGFFTFLFGILIVLLGWLWVAIIAGTTSVQQVEANTAQLEDHEQRLRLIEADLGEVRNDVAWIRHHLENGGQ